MKPRTQSNHSRGGQSRDRNVLKIEVTESAIMTEPVRARRLVAEGVETLQTLTALASMGCDVAQGYFLPRPVTAAAFDAWYAERRTAPAPAHFA